MSFLALVLAFAMPTGVVDAVRIDRVGLRPAVTVVTRGGSGAVGVRREGGEIILTVGATLQGALRLPKEVPPLEGLSAAMENGATAIHLSVAESVPFQIVRTEDSISVVLGPVEATSAVPIGERPSAQELYPLIFAVPAEVGDASLPPATPDTDTSAARKDDEEGIYIGFVRLRPSVLFNYIDAETALFDTPQPTRQRYFEVDPRIGLGLGFGLGTQLSLFGGRLEVQYEPRFRPSASLAVLRRPTQSLTVKANVPIGSTVALRASHHYVRGFLETTEVDPGREYFFDLGQFTNHETEVGARLDTGSRLDVDVAVARATVDIDDNAGFFDHRSDRLTVGTGYKVRPDLRAVLAFTATRVPPAPLRPQAESDSSKLTLGLEGEVLPLVHGVAHAGFEDRRSPNAAAGGTRFRGFVADAALDKEFTPSSRFGLSGQRSTELSFFEDNAFYVSNRVEAVQTMGLPFYLAFRGAVGEQWNRYQTVAVGLNEPRRDDIFGWSVGLGRPFTRWAYLRADYRHERRRSNLPAFRVTNHALVLQVGIGYLGNAQP